MSKRIYRKRSASKSDDDDVVTTKSRICDVVELQKLRKQTDFNIKKKKKIGKLDDSEYELCDVKSLLKSKNEELTFNDGFAQETNSRNEDADMTKFIEEELAKRTGIVSSNENNQEK